MKTSALRLTRVVACVLLIGVFANGHAQWAVIDASNLQQSMQQYVQMVEQVSAWNLSKRWNSFPSRRKQGD